MPAGCRVLIVSLIYIQTGHHHHYAQTIEIILVYYHVHRVAKIKKNVQNGEIEIVIYTIVFRKRVA